ncbi:unnamed protein product [Pleuronectes platessa]|uniref:Uncharacterized protein n=1 Tax=Pleuronectes platessa TaxID=8262 RepID=A0A9N7V5X3_PLEPL|nr:unnamed protein product [Pleuronectes platessa]
MWNLFGRQRWKDVRLCHGSDKRVIFSQDPCASPLGFVVVYSRRWGDGFPRKRPDTCGHVAGLEGAKQGVKREADLGIRLDPEERLNPEPRAEERKETGLEPPRSPLPDSS